VFDLSFHITAVFQERQIHVLSVGSRINYLHTHSDTIINTTHISTVFTVVTNTFSTP